tara:strand:+ start:755 stop:967 length:213 start_codon:yes stop_codon:yes gene_type:complete
MSQFALKVSADLPQRLQLGAGCFPQAALSVLKQAIHQALMLSDGDLHLIQGNLQLVHALANVDNHESATA